ncbi:MAG TPA: M42 family metallopeptidase [Bacilli bacterium]|nr:M42 family metallopeptidase [Bacilli bacterium]
MDATVKMIKELSELHGAPGFERDVRKKMEEYLLPLSDEVITDRLGGIVGKKTGEAQGPKIMLVGHLDEVGWMVTHVTKGGFLRIQPLGGWWPHVMLGQRVRIRTRKNGEHIGLIGSKAPHVLKVEDRAKVLEMKDMFIDVGAKSREEIEEMGIRPGDPITPEADFFEMRDGAFWAGKALDNRAGCALAVEVMKRLQEENHPNVVYSGATVQEEVGSRGAITISNLVNPDIAFALDVGIAYDTPGFELYPRDVKMDEGPLAMIFDAKMIPQVGLRDLVMDTAKELGIHLQVDALAGGATDGANTHIHGIGCPTIAMGFALRYIHTHTAMMSRKDFEQAADLVAAVIKKLDNKVLEEILDR